VGAGEEGDELGHSRGGGEMARCVGRHGENRVANVVLVSA
jgi:pimeloyl-ACP methyl ester carboxylesterase